MDNNIFILRKMVAGLVSNKPGFFWRDNVGETMKESGEKKKKVRVFLRENNCFSGAFFVCHAPILGNFEF